MNSLSGPSEEMGSTDQQTRLTDNIVNYLTLRNGVIVLIVLIIYLVIEANIPDVAPGVVKFSIRGVVVAGALIIYLSEAPNWDDLFVYFKWFAIAFFLVAFLFSLEVHRTGDPNVNPFQNVYNHMVNGWGSDSAKAKPKQVVQQQHQIRSVDDLNFSSVEVKAEWTEIARINKECKFYYRASQTFIIKDEAGNVFYYNKCEPREVRFFHFINTQPGTIIYVARPEKSSDFILQYQII